YRFGDSPRGKNGGLEWAAATSLRTAENQAEWRPCGVPGVPSGRAGNKFLWLRTTLSGPRVTDPASQPALFLMGVDQLFEAYLDGKLVYRFGVLDGERAEARRFAGYKAHYIPIGDNYQGKTLALRIYSEHVNIGVYGDVYIGSQLALTVATVRMGQD